MGLCYRHHRRHDNATERVPWAFLTSANINFARELGLDWLLEKHYPRYMPEGDDDGRDGLHQAQSDTGH